MYHSFIYDDTDNKNDKSVYTLVSPNLEDQQYIKKSLVPFTETLEFTSGSEDTIFSLKNKSIGVMICYDSVFIQKYINSKTVDLYIVGSNDSFSDGLGMAFLHESITKMYAKLFRKPLLFVSQSTRSFYVDSNGYSTDLTRRFTQDVIKLDIKI